MDKTFFITGAFLAMTGVAAGAFGAHGLKGSISDDMLVVYEVGVRYQMYHAFSLMILGLTLNRWYSRFLVAGGYSFCAGVLIFSGSLYLLSIFGIPWLGAVTPIGGGALLVGWALIIYGVIKSHGNSQNT